jgi:WD40 repeat protein
LWNSGTGKALKKFAGHTGHVLSAQFSPDGTLVVTASVDKTARVWDAATGKALAKLVGHKSTVESAQFSPDGTLIVTTSRRDGTVRLWDVLPKDPGPLPEWFPDFLRYMAQMRLNPDGELETLKAADWLALRERLRAVRRASASTDTPYLRLLRKYVRE